MKFMISLIWTTYILLRTSILVQPLPHAELALPTALESGSAARNVDPDESRLLDEDVEGDSDTARGHQGSSDFISSLLGSFLPVFREEDDGSRVRRTRRPEHPSPTSTSTRRRTVGLRPGLPQVAWNRDNLELFSSPLTTDGHHGFGDQFPWSREALVDRVDSPMQTWPVVEERFDLSTWPGHASNIGVPRKRLPEHDGRRRSHAENAVNELKEQSSRVEAFCQEVLQAVSRGVDSHSMQAMADKHHVPLVRKASAGQMRRIVDMLCADRHVRFNGNTSPGQGYNPRQALTTDVMVTVKPDEDTDTHLKASASYSSRPSRDRPGSRKNHAREEMQPRIVVDGDGRDEEVPRLEHYFPDELEKLNKVPDHHRHRHDQRDEGNQLGEKIVHARPAGDGDRFYERPLWESSSDQEGNRHVVPRPSSSTPMPRTTRNLIRTSATVFRQ